MTWSASPLPGRLCAPKVRWLAGVDCKPESPGLIPQADSRIWKIAILAKHLIRKTDLLSFIHNGGVHWYNLFGRQPENLTHMYLPQDNSISQNRSCRYPYISCMTICMQHIQFIMVYRRSQNWKQPRCLSTRRGLLKSTRTHAKLWATISALEEWGSSIWTDVE